jgi:hypothetical protein
LSLEMARIGVAGRKNPSLTSPWPAKISALRKNKRS